MILLRKVLLHTPRTCLINGVVEDACIEDGNLALEPLPGLGPDTEAALVLPVLRHHEGEVGGQDEVAGVGVGIDLKGAREAKQ